jgi:large conductance mechanosensitive channel
MIKGFKEFMMRGNVVDLAIAVVIGGAFSGIVSQLTKSFIEPLVKIFGGGGISGGSFVIKGTSFDWAAFVNSVFNFVIVSAVVYFFIVVPMNRLLAMRKKESAEAPAPAQELESVALLREIRDLLKEEKG